MRKAPIFFILVPLALCATGEPFSHAQTVHASLTATHGDASIPPTSASYRQFALQTEAMLHHDILDPWFPRAIDTQHGGFHADFDRQWRPRPSHGKFSVFQARMTWSAAAVAVRRPALREQYLPYTQHGLAYLEDALWDKQYGGFFWGLEDDGQPGTRYGDGKHMYGMSFCIYALAASYKADHNPDTLAFAQRAFAWMEQHSHTRRMVDITSGSIAKADHFSPHPMTRN